MTFHNCFWAWFWLAHMPLDHKSSFSCFLCIVKLSPGARVTSFSSFSNCTARCTMGPRTAYSTRFTLGFMVSRVSTLPRCGTPFTACWDIFLLLCHAHAVVFRRCGSRVWYLKEQKEKHHEWAGIRRRSCWRADKEYQHLPAVPQQKLARLVLVFTFPPAPRALTDSWASRASYSHPLDTPSLAPAHGWSIPSLTFPLFPQRNHGPLYVRAE